MLLSSHRECGLWPRTSHASTLKFVNQVTTLVPRAIYMHALKALPSNVGPLMHYHAERYGLQPSTLRAVKPPFPVQVTLRSE